MIKEKLSKILKLLLNEQKSKFFEKEPSFKKRKISFLFFILENFFSNIETTFLSSFKNNLIFQFKKLELKTIYLRNKTTLINENLFQIKSKYSSRFNFIKKRKIFIDPTNAFLNLNFRKKQFFIALENFCVELRFELGNGGTQRRLSNKARVSGFGKVFMLSDGTEVFKLFY